MCFKTKAPPMPAVAATPSRADVQGDVTIQRKKLAERRGVFGNIFTSPLGDSNYGSAGRPLAALTPGLA